MIKKKKEGSELIKFKRTSNNENISSFVDGLIKEFKIIQKHLSRKKKILINLIANLVINHNRGLNTAIPRSESFYSKIKTRYKSDIISHDLIVEFIDLMKSNDKYVIEKYKASRNEFGEASLYSPSNLLIKHCKDDIINNYTLLEDECILLRKKIINNNTISNGELTQNTSSSSSDEVTVEETISSGIEDEGEITQKHRKMLVDYSDTDYTRSIRSDLNEYNRFRIQNTFSLKGLPMNMLDKKYKENIQRFASVNISKLIPDAKNRVTVPLAPDHLVRIFTEDFEKGGRFYRGFETQLKKELRPFIAINGEPTVEFDYSNYHIRMLYHLHNKRCPDDPYTVFEGLDPDDGRDYYKTMVAACLNNNNEKSVLRTMRYYITKNGLRDYFSDITNEGLKAGLKLLLNHNRKVAQYLFHGDGLEYHKIDSDIANDIMMYFTRLKKPILVLCVHDSFIIARTHSDQLHRAMNKFYRAKVHKYPKIK